MTNITNFIFSRNRNSIIKCCVKYCKNQNISEFVESFFSTNVSTNILSVLESLLSIIISQLELIVVILNSIISFTTSTSFFVIHPCVCCVEAEGCHLVCSDSRSWVKSGEVTQGKRSERSGRTPTIPAQTPLQK